MEKYQIDSREVAFFGNSNSSMDVKFNRVTKIASRYDKIKNKLLDYIDNNRSYPTSKEYNLGVAFLIIITTGIRIGNEDSAEGFYSDYKVKGKTVFAKTYGLTTLLPRHISVEEGKVKMHFTGKKHVINSFELPEDVSKLIIPIIKSKYVPVFNIHEGELTKFISDITSPYFSSKDFRTFRANVYGYNFAKGLPPYTTKSERRERINAVTEHVSKLLNNTAGVVKTSYLDPRLFDYFFPDKIIENKQDGGLFKFNFKC